MDTSVVEKKHEFKIKVDDLIYEFGEPIVTGSEILVKAGKTPVECFSLYQKFKGCDFERISLDEKVNLSKPGLKHFTVKAPEVFYYTVDGEQETTDRKILSAEEILSLAGLEPKDYYLVQIRSDGSQIQYNDSPDQQIEMKCPGLKFVSAFRSGTPVA